MANVSTRRASLRVAVAPLDRPTVLGISVGLSLVRQTHYLLPYRQEEGGDGEQEVMIHSVQVKLVPLITPLIGRPQDATPLSPRRAPQTGVSQDIWLTINDLF